MTDQEIASKAKLKPIQLIAKNLGINEEELEPYGRYKAKLPLALIDDKKVAESKLVLVTALSPTPAGEGKTTMSIGLSEGLNRIGKRTTVVLREPSLGPVFGMKGGATGGGYSQVVPMEDINLHFTGDFAAVEKAHNLLAALIDNNLQSKSKSLGLDPRQIYWKRVMDMNDRSLRKAIIGLGGAGMGIPRETGFDITAASEIMAILCLATDLVDLKERLGRIFVGYTLDKQPVYARDLKAHGAMAALLKDAIKPNLVQTLEGNPAIIHGGPFANIAQGTNSVLATKLGLSLSDFVVTEAGFGADLGAEKFFDIKCRLAGLNPSAVVIVATIRALRYHGGVGVKELNHSNTNAVKLGLANLGKHIENVLSFGVPALVAINQFTSDTKEETDLVIEFCAKLNVSCTVANVWAEGGKGAEALAKKVADVTMAEVKPFKPVYNLDESIEIKIEKIATKIYGASAVSYTAQALEDLRRINDLGLTNSAVCVAKTQKSFSDDQTKIGRPSGFVISVKQIEIAAGAGFVVPITGEMMRMPGLPSTPAAEGIDIDAHGNITGLF